MIAYHHELSESSVETIISNVEVLDDYLSVINQIRHIDSRNVPVSIPNNSDISIALTNKCNLRCRYCLSECKTHSCQFDIIEVFLSNLIYCSKKSRIVISITGGGEPTFDQDLFVKSINKIRELEQLYSKKVFIRITTNGYFDNNMCDFIINKVDSIMLSFDVLPHLQNTNRVALNGDSFDVVSNNLHKLLSSSLHVSVRATLFPCDFSEMTRIVDVLFSNYGTLVDLSIMPVLPEGLASACISNTDDAVSFVKYFIISNHLAHIKFNKSISSPVIQSNLRSFFCGGVLPILSQVWLKPDGLIYTCLDYNQPIGYVDRGIHFFDHVYDELMEFAASQMESCKDCIAFRFCKGGCPSRHMLYRRRGLDNWSCTVLQKYWETNLKLALNNKSSDCVFVLKEVCGVPYYQLIV